MLAFKFQVFLMRFFRRVKSACANTFAVNHNLRSPFTLMSANTQKTNFIGFGCFSHILQITKPSNLSQIGKRIIFFVSVNVINMLRGPFSGHINPSNTMRENFSVVNGNCPIASIGFRTCNFPQQIFTICSFYPNKMPCIWVILKDRSNMVRRYHDSHFSIRIA